MTPLVNSDGCSVWYQPDAFTREADDLLPRLLAWPGFAADLSLGIAARRLTCAFGQLGARYRYSGTTKVAWLWPDFISSLRAALEIRLGEVFDFALVNLYPDGRAGLGWHSDDERDLKVGSPIVSVSLGAARVFALRNISTGATAGALLTHGSLCVMAGDTQRQWQHCITKDARVKLPRVSITFRRLA